MQLLFVNTGLLFTFFALNYFSNLFRWRGITLVLQCSYKNELTVLSRICDNGTNGIDIIYEIDYALS